ncbi:TonB-dependent receptor domain-containing protein [Flavobacterium sp. RHBU_3]|uniref:TonB-dependent receptor domain-containing protein n=1 Tax=Flavobacterium sp. RHBU_3 TaxID=3391184 RepID=UPI0039847DC4
MNHSATKPGYCRLTTLSKVFSILFFLCITAAFAQGTLHGTVNDAEGKPLQNVEVLNPETGSNTKTDASGAYTIALKSGDNKLVFYKEGYLFLEKVIPGDATFDKVSMEKIIELNEVVVQREKEKRFALNHLRDIEGTAIYAGKKTEVINLDKLTVNKATNNTRQVYGQVVGLTINENSDGGLQLNIGGRGLNPNRSSNFNTRQNGYDISADVLGYPESYYTPPTEALSQIEVIRGAASLQYGTQFGGLVNFKFYDPSAKPIEIISRNTGGSYGLYTNFTSLSGTQGKFSYYTFFNYKQGDGFRPNSEFNSRNYFANLNYKFTQKTSLHFDYTLFDYLAKQPGGLTDAMYNQDMFQSNRSRNWFHVNWNLFALKLKHKFTEDANFSLQLFGLDASRKALGYRATRVSTADVPGTERDLLVGDFVNWGAEARFLQKYTLGKQKSALLVGAKYYHAQNTSEQGPGSSGSEPDFHFAYDEFPNYTSQSDYTYPNQNVSFFGENIFRLSSKFTITPGFRFENIRTEANGYRRRINVDGAGNIILDENVYQDVVKNRNFVLLGVGLSYKPTNSIEWYGNVSQNYRSVTFSDISVVSPAQAIDPNIMDEKGYTSDVGLRGHIDDRFSFDTSIYALFYDKKIGEIQATDPNGGAAVVRYRTNLGTAITYGWEMLADWNISRTYFRDSESFTWNVFVNNALTKSEYTKSDITGVKGKEVEFVPLVNIKSGTTAGYKNFMMSLQFTYLSSQYTDAKNIPTDDTDNSNGTFGQIPAYYVADFSASYTWRRFKLEAGINNFTNNYYFTRRATGYPGPGILPSDPRTFYATLQIKI